MLHRKKGLREQYREKVEQQKKVPDGVLEKKIKNEEKGKKK